MPWFRKQSNSGTNDAMVGTRRWPVARVASKNRCAVTTERSSVSRPSMSSQRLSRLINSR